MEILGYISLFFVGLILGTLGGGGSILSVPILVYLFSLDAVMASAYSLFIVGTTSLVGSVLKYHTQMVSLRTGFIFGIPSLIAIFITRKWMVPAIPDIILQIETFQLTKRALILGIFALLMILASLALISKKDKTQSEKSRHPGIFLIVWGLLTGLLTGLVGAGGGFIIIPALVYLTDLPFKTAVGTTLLIIAANSLTGFTGDVINHVVNWHFLLLITSLAIAGIFIGSGSTRKIPTDKLRISFGWFTLVVGTLILIREVSFCTTG
jgi:uncharacterized membrane protein YfcA